MRSQNPNPQCYGTRALLLTHAVAAAGPRTLTKTATTMQKRPHAKVRSGCLRCKSKKVKCNEAVPACSHCQRYAATCVYPSPRHRATGGPSPTLANGWSEPPRRFDMLNDLSGETTNLTVSELELLHHWTMFACRGFGDRPDDVEPWQVEIPQIACKHPFLMRGILAVSALHLSRVRPERKHEYLVKATHHQNLALPLYRYIINDFRNQMTKDNCHAVVGFASLTSAYSFADPHPLGRNQFPGVSSSTGVPEWLHLLRGAREILKIGSNWVAEGPMAFQLRTVDENIIDLSCNPDDARLVELYTLFAEPEPEPESMGLYCSDPGSSSSSSSSSDSVLSEPEIRACRTTLDLLRESYAMPLLPARTVGIKLSLFLWVEKVPKLYLELLREMKPEALILLAYFAVLLKTGASHYWYMEGAAERLVSALKDILHDKWKQWIAWPLEVIKGAGTP